MRDWNACCLSRSGSPHRCLGAIRRSNGALPSFTRSIFGGYGGAVSIVEGPADQTDASKSQDHASESCPKHSFCPESHVLLGFQIGYLAVLLPLALLGVFAGYLITYRGLDRIENGSKAVSIGLLLAGAVLALFCAGICPASGTGWLSRAGSTNSGMA